MFKFGNFGRLYNLKKRSLPMKMRKGFTLIELLIVVAIIAILAAIAVPNFLEAQTRAKNTRSVANMRNLATAIETYRIDNKGATPTGYCNYWWCNRAAYTATLTTPVAYMTSIVEDPFLRDWYNSPGMPDWTKVVLAEYQLWDHTILHALFQTPQGSAPGLWPFPPNYPAFTSQEKTNLENSVHQTFIINKKEGTNYMMRGQGPKLRTQSYTLLYDPSNGTISDGHIIYFN
jgi:prepilin-type N-terminal cleavage/methylation domain-containing protein